MYPGHESASTEFEYYRRLSIPRMKSNPLLIIHLHVRDQFYLRPEDCRMAGNHVGHYTDLIL